MTHYTSFWQSWKQRFFEWLRKPVKWSFPPALFACILAYPFPRAMLCIIFPFSIVGMTDVQIGCQERCLVKAKLKLQNLCRSRECCSYYFPVDSSP
jgi:hypothetical protein